MVYQHQKNAITQARRSCQRST